MQVDPAPPIEEGPEPEQHNLGKPGDHLEERAAELVVQSNFLLGGVRNPVLSSHLRAHVDHQPAEFPFLLQFSVHADPVNDVELQLARVREMGHNRQELPAGECNDGALPVLLQI